MTTLIKKISSKLVEGDFDVQSEMLWQIEAAFRKAEDQIIIEFPKPEFGDGREYSVRRNLDKIRAFNESSEMQNWNAKIKYELEQQGFSKITDGKNVVELHTPTNSVFYNYNNAEILIYKK